MDIEEGYYDCIVEKTEDCDHGPCTAYTAYLNGHAAFTVYLYSDKPEIISIHEEWEDTMYYVETKIKLRIEREENAKDLYWLREAIDQYLEGPEEVVFIERPKVINEGWPNENVLCWIG